MDAIAGRASFDRAQGQNLTLAAAAGCNGESDDQCVQPFRQGLPPEWRIWALAVIESARPGTDDKRHFSAALQSLAAEAPCARIEFGTISQFMGNRSIGALLLFFALPMVLPIPMPGISIVFGIPLILIGIQLLLGHRHAWLPAWLARRSIARTDLTVYIHKALPTLHQIESVLRPRMAALTGNKAMRLVGAVCFVLALIIALPIPFGHWVPGLSISIMALGMMERDGLMVGAGLLIAVIALLIVAWATSGLVALGQAFI